MTVNRLINSHNQPLLFRAWRMVVCLCVLLATGALAECQFMKPVDGPGMEREVNDSLDLEKGDSVIAETSQAQRPLLLQSRLFARREVPAQDGRKSQRVR